MKQHSRSEMVQVARESSEPYLTAMEAAGRRIQAWIDELPKNARVVNRKVECRGHYVALASLYWAV